MHTPDIDIVTNLTADDGNRAFEPRISRNSKISVHFSLSWQSDYATHIDSQFIDNLNVWRDFFPPEGVLSTNLNAWAWYWNTSSTAAHLKICTATHYADYRARWMTSTPAS